MGIFPAVLGAELSGALIVVFPRLYREIMGGHFASEQRSRMPHNMTQETRPVLTIFGRLVGTLSNRYAAKLTHTVEKWAQRRPANNPFRRFSAYLSRASQACTDRTDMCR